MENANSKLLAKFHLPCERVKLILEYRQVDRVDDRVDDRKVRLKSSKPGCTNAYFCYPRTIARASVLSCKFVMNQIE